MITKIDCPCGNTDTSKAKYYDGCLGYEAIICTVCGTYWDFDEHGKGRENKPDDWSKKYIPCTKK